MKSIYLFSKFCLGILFICLQSGCSFIEKSENLPNTVLKIEANPGWKDVGFNGNKYFETIDKLAAGGMYFTRFYPSSANWATSRASILAGLYTPRHTVYVPQGLVGGGEVSKMRFKVQTEDQDSTFITYQFSINSVSPETESFAKVLTGAQTDRKFTPGKIWPDTNGKHINAHGGGILLHEGVYYWYGQFMVEGESGNRAQVGVSCYSSSDLYNWKNEGISLKVDETNPESDIAKGCILERPKVIFNERTDKFVMWFHLELKDEGYDSALSGVAVSDNVTGPFTYLKSFRPNAGYWPLNVKPFHKKPVAPTVKNKYSGGKGGLPAHPDSLNLLGRDFESGQMARDMNLFVDDDGTAYHIYSSEENSTLHISKLSDDYLTYSGEYIRVFSDRYMEGAALFKRNGKYYIFASGCTGWAPNAARSAVADHIFGNWTELGNPCIGENAELTFYSQSTFVMPVKGKKDTTFIYMGDRWTPENPIDGRHIWLPVEFKGDKPVLRWFDSWSLK